jgi:3-phenylpropionate/trans-cinnamate dioxygenase ferredoxin reductase subunit
VIIGAASLSYRAVPWFWSDQHDMRLQMAGLSSGADQFVMRGDAESGQFSLFAFRRGRLIAVDSVNSPGDHVMARKMLEGNCRLSPNEAADRSFDLRSVVKNRTREIA